MQTYEGRPDVIVRGPSRDPVVVVEVKNREGLTPGVAAQLRGNMAAHGLLGRAAYFLLLSQDVGYLWREEPDAPWDVPPTAQFPMRSVVERYASTPLDGKRLRGLELELLIVHWLSELSLGQHTRNGALEEPERSLEEAGLLDVLRGASVEPEGRG